jgi:hypothetical protein
VLASAAATIFCGLLAAAGCGGGTGVCTGAGPARTYCKDGWTESECKDWDAKMVNGVRWYFYAGQTCAERGTPATP